MLLRPATPNSGRQVNPPNSEVYASKHLDVRLRGEDPVDAQHESSQSRRGTLLSQQF
jgi:hypothetical protein